MNKTVREFMVSLQDNVNSDDEDEQVDDGVEDIIPHLIPIDDHDGGPKLHVGEDYWNHECFSHIATIVTMDGPACCTARLQNVLIAHGVTATLPNLCIGNKYYGVLAGPEAAQGSSGGGKQYHACCNFVAHKPNVRLQCLGDKVLDAWALTDVYSG